MGKPYNRQAQRRTWLATAIASMHDFCGRATVLVGERSPHKPQDKKHRESNATSIFYINIKSQKPVELQPGHRTEERAGAKGEEPAEYPVGPPGQRMDGGKRIRGDDIFEDEDNVADDKGCRRTKGAEERQHQRKNQKMAGIKKSIDLCGGATWRWDAGREQRVPMP